jgi:hypothetical protein
MFADQRKIPGTRWLFAAAMALASVVGYWCGHETRDSAGLENANEVSVRGHRQREIDRKAPPLTAVGLVREAVKGTVDERKQWLQVRCFSEDEVKVAIKELSDSDHYSIPNHTLEEMLYYRWGELDPMAANAAAKARFPNKFPRPRQAVIAAWIKQGGAVAAWHAVKDEGGMWDCTRSVGGEVADMLVASYSDLDDAKAFKEVLLLDDDNSVIADTLCRARAGKASISPESRTAFLAAAATHPEPYIMSCAYKFLFREWAKRDLEAARGGEDSMKIPEEFVEEVRWEIDRIADEMEREKEQATEKAGAKQ